MALKILLADDSMTAQNMGKKILVDAGYDVVAVSNGAAAIKKISSERPDIAILDEYMPGYTGSEVCERVKASPETSKIPVLLTVGKMEPFDQVKANKVRADGVMIKPFEASDLIAAVQSIAQRLLAPAPPVRAGQDATVQLRAGHAGYEETVRVPAPPRPPEPNHEDTLRLTPDQIKAFQDASYQDWASTAEKHLEEHEKEAAPSAAAEMLVTASVEEAPAPSPIPSEIPEPPAMPAALDIDAATQSRATPVFSAMAVSGVAAEHEIFTTSTTPVAPVDEDAAGTATPVFYTPPAVEVPAIEEETPIFAVESEVPAVQPEPLISTLQEKATVPPVLEPVLETAPVTPAAEVAPVLETSAPLTPGPMPVEAAPELEPTIVPTVEVAAHTIHELEITSPPQERGGTVIAQDAALITESEDMAQFTTKFGVEGAEPVHVGVVSDLSEEQLAAIMSPSEAHAAPAAAEVETATVVPEPAAVVPEPVVPEAPVAAQIVTSPVQEAAPQTVVPQVEAAEPPVTAEPEPVRAPSIEDTQPIQVVAEPELEQPALEVVSAPVTEPVHETVEEVQPAVVEPPSAAIEQAPEVVQEVSIAAIETAPVAVEKEPAVAHISEIEETPAMVESAVETESTAMAAAVSDVPQLEAPVTEESHKLEHVAEAALAAIAGSAAVAGVAHVIHPEPAKFEMPSVVVPAVEEMAHVDAAPAPERVEAEPESFGDAALAEELAAALAIKETEERAKAAAEAAAAAALEPAATVAAAPVAGMGLQGLSDSKLAEAVARAFENLKPQLITEIIKELAK